MLLQAKTFLYLLHFLHLKSFFAFIHFIINYSSYVFHIKIHSSYIYPDILFIQVHFGFFGSFVLVFSDFTAPDKYYSGNLLTGLPDICTRLLRLLNHLKHFCQLLRSGKNFFPLQLPNIIAAFTIIFPLSFQNFTIFYSIKYS